MIHQLIRWCSAWSYTLFSVARKCHRLTMLFFLRAERALKLITIRLIPFEAWIVVLLGQDFREIFDAEEEEAARRRQPKAHAYLGGLREVGSLKYAFDRTSHSRTCSLATHLRSVFVATSAFAHSELLHHRIFCFVLFVDYQWITYWMPPRFRHWSSVRESE